MERNPGQRGHRSTFSADAIWRDPDDGLVIAIDWKIHNEVPVAEAVSIRSTANEGISARKVHRLPLGRIINAERARLIEDGTLADDLQPLTRFTESEFAEFASDAGPDQGRHLTEDALRLVAHLYIEAYRNGDPVQRGVADQLGVSIPTAARRIGLARDRGYIDHRYSQSRGRQRDQ